MNFSGVEIQATPFVSKAPCRKCHNYLKMVSNGLFENVLFCPKCEIVYELKLIRVPEKKLSKEFLEQCRQETKKV